MKTVVRDMKCKNCRGTGIIDDHDYLGDGIYFSEPNGKKRTCGACDGRKTHKVILLISDDPCEASYKHAPLKCNAGTLRNTEPFYRYGENSFGEQTRELIQSYSERCEICFGTGKKHYDAIKTYCSTCAGSGKKNEYYWEKNFFGGEVRRERQRTCPSCQGEKYKWNSGFLFATPYVQESNI